MDGWFYGHTPPSHDDIIVFKGQILLIMGVVSKTIQARRGARPEVNSLHL